MSEAAGRRPRRGLVLGAGGVLGAAWSIGAMCALEEVLGFDVRTVDVIVGTSAGSVLTALVGAGVDPRRAPAQPARPRDRDRTAGRLRLRPRPRDRRCAALAPEGRARLDQAAHAVGASPHPGHPDGCAVLVAPDRSRQSRPRSSTSWPRSPPAAGGRRTRAAGSSRWTTTLAAASRSASPASRSHRSLTPCSPPARSPAWYAPVEIGGRRYIDGGTCSPTSVDLLVEEELDEVYVLAPMASFAYDSPTSMAAKLERGFRRTVTKRMVREAGRVRATARAGDVARAGSRGPAGHRREPDGPCATGDRARDLGADLDRRPAQVEGRRDLLVRMRLSA